MTEKVKKFIEDNIQLIEYNNWEELFAEAFERNTYSINFAGQLASTLGDANIDCYTWSGFSSIDNFINVLGILDSVRHGLMVSPGGYVSDGWFDKDQLDDVIRLAKLFGFQTWKYNGKTSVIFGNDEIVYVLINPWGNLSEYLHRQEVWYNTDQIPGEDEFIKI